VWTASCSATYFLVPQLLSAPPFSATAVVVLLPPALPRGFAGRSVDRKIRFSEVAPRG
jgi:hypothetical protein